MIIIDGHGEYPLSGPPTFVPPGVEVWFYTERGSALHASQAVEILARGALPPPHQRIGPGEEIDNHVLAPLSPWTRQARRLVTAPELLPHLVHDLPDGTALCTGGCGSGPRHRCDGLLASVAPGVLVMLICRGLHSDSQVDHYVDLYPFDEYTDPPHTYPARSQGFVKAVATHESIAAVHELVEAACMAESDGFAALCLSRGGVTTDRFAFHLGDMAGKPGVQDVLAYVENGRAEFEAWLSAVRTADDDDLAALIAQRDGADLRYAAALDRSARRALTSPGGMRATAASVWYRDGALALLVLADRVHPRVLNAILADAVLLEAIAAGRELVSELELDGHERRLSWWLQAGGGERAALGEHVRGRRAELPGLMRWLDELHTARAAIRAAFGNAGGLGVLHRLTTLDMTRWLGACDDDPEVRTARTREATRLAEFDGGADHVRHRIWSALTDDQRAMFPRLSTEAASWSRRAETVLMWADEALRRDGGLGLLVLLGTLTAPQRLAVRLTGEVEEARLKARYQVEVFESGELGKRLLAWARLSERDREQMLRLSPVARRTAGLVDTVERELSRLAATGTDGELLARWRSNRPYQRVVRSKPERFATLLARIDSLPARRVRAPSVRRLLDEVEPGTLRLLANAENATGDATLMHSAVISASGTGAGQPG
jgi:hypothetical protein